jgi:ribosome-binding factor A
MTTENRAGRIAEAIHQELATLLKREVSDPRLTNINVTHVSVDRELAYATIHVSALDGADRREEILKGLKAAQGFLRSRLAAVIALRSFPRLRFRWDSSAERAARIEELLGRLKGEAGDRQDEAEER